MKTQATEILHIKYPLIAGNMMNISKPEFVAACSNAGALGILASVIYREPEPLRAALRQLMSLTKQPFAVNVNLFPMLKPIRQDRLIQIMIDEGVKIIETSGHEAPDKFIPMFKQNDVLWIHKCAGVRYAQKAEKLGADIVEVVGWENGGATGKYDIGTIVLTPATIDALKIPVIAGGGIADGRGLVAVLALGAQAGLLGTRLLMTKECPIHENLKQALVKASIYDTVIIMRSVDATHRAWNNEAAKRVLQLEQTKSGMNEIFDAAAGVKSKKMYDEGDLTAGIVACSQSVGLAKDIIPVQELFDRIMIEAEGIIKRLSSL